MAEENLNKNNKDLLSWSDSWKELWKLLNSFKSLFFLILFFLFLTTALSITKPYILKLVIDGFSSFADVGISKLIILALLYLGSDNLQSLLSYFSGRKIFKFLIDVEYFLSMKAQEKLVFLNLSYHEKENTGIKVVRVERGMGKISNLLESIVWELAPTVLQFIFTLVALFYTDWRIGLSFLLFAPAFVVITFLANRKMHPIRKNIYSDYEKASGKMVQSIININTVQSFVQEDRELNDFGLIRKKVRDSEHKQWYWMNKINFGRGLILDIGRATVLLLGAYLVYYKTISVGSLIFSFSLSELAYSSLYRLSRVYDRFEEGREGISRLINLFNATDDIENKDEGIVAKNIKGEIEFQNVFFSYQDNKLQALDEVSFKIKAGSVVALVGPSGGGKTTVAKMIYRHYDPKQGSVLLDGENLKDYNLRSFRKFFAIVPQEVEIFDLSVLENISYANPKASLKEIKEAAKIANADDFISQMPDGYNSLVGERGIRLSGGQRQRLGIARAILANPKVIVFDEATSSLDSESEKLIQDSMKKIGKGRTMIIIAHRLSTIAQADNIIVLENGKVVESGSHSDLKNNKGGLYNRLLGFQIDGYLK